MAVKPRKKSWERKRPIAVTVVAWGIVALFFIRLFNVLQPLIHMRLFDVGIISPLIIGMRLTPLGLALVVSASYMLQVLVGIVVLIGFLRLQRWAWVVMMAWTAASLCISLVDYFYGHANFLVMASNVIIAVALSQSDVQRIFRIRMDINDITI